LRFPNNFSNELRMKSNGQARYYNLLRNLGPSTPSTEPNLLLLTFVTSWQACWMTLPSMTFTHWCMLLP
jgi:hypothetical protein